jgi:ubiquinone/menaquinone biosynthesis C-methylase UbiE
MKCRFCKNQLVDVFLNLGYTPLANSYLKKTEIDKPELSFPLCAYVCKKCFLVQIDEEEKPENIFTDYAYFSSYSKTWLKHIEEFSKEMIRRFQLNKESKVIEIASNDGYLLKNFKKKNIPILGIEPASNVAKFAKKKGIPTVEKFFSNKTATELVKKHHSADILIAVNVLPHVPNLNDFLKGIKKILKPNGTVIVQFSAYLSKLISQREFDTIYHEHYSYFSLFTLNKIFSAHDLKIFDVDELSIHGGSLRIYATHKKQKVIVSKKIQKLIDKEKKLGLRNLATYKNFNERVISLKFDLWKFFINAQKQGKKVVCYGAPAKGNTLLNYCGIKNDLIEFTVDISPHKQGLYLPGTHIPIYNPSHIKKNKPDYVLILAWNLKKEIMEQMNFIRDWGGKFVTPIPNVRVIQ